MTNPNINFLDHHTLHKMLMAQCAEFVWFYIGLGKYVSYDADNDMVHYEHKSIDELAKDFQTSYLIIKEAIWELEFQGFINVVPYSDGRDYYLLEQLSMKAVRETARRFGEVSDD